MSSTDAISWSTSISLTSRASWSSITYSEDLSLFVVVATTGLPGQRIATSSNGITWTTRVTPDITLNSITWSPQLAQFVAVGSPINTNTYNILTSPNGITWTNRTTGTSDWKSVYYNNSIFVAVGYNIVMTSTNGITWTVGTAVTGNWEGISSNGGLLIAVGSNNRIMTSIDGITWTNRTSPVSSAWKTIIYSNSKFVALGNNANVITLNDDVYQSINGSLIVGNPTGGNKGKGTVSEAIITTVFFISFLIIQYLFI
jgi:hypothetical protein